MKKGTTLIELVLYVALIVIMFSAVVPFAHVVLQNGSKNEVQSQLASSARQISERISYEIRNASSINSVSASSISIQRSGSPTVISLSSGNLQITKSGDTQNLNPSGVTVSSVVFTNNTSVGNSTENISFAITVTRSSTSTRQEFEGAVSVRGSAEIRSN